MILGSETASMPQPIPPQHLVSCRRLRTLTFSLCQHRIIPCIPPHDEVVMPSTICEHFPLSSTPLSRSRILANIISPPSQHGTHELNLGGFSSTLNFKCKEAISRFEAKLTTNKDLKKVTFYCFADAYINFNSLGTDLFKVYKTRIWMIFVLPGIPMSDVPRHTILDLCRHYWTPGGGGGRAHGVAR